MTDYSTDSETHIDENAPPTTKTLCTTSSEMLSDPSSPGGNAPNATEEKACPVSPTTKAFSNLYSATSPNTVTSSKPSLLLPSSPKTKPNEENISPTTKAARLELLQARQRATEARIRGDIAIDPNDQWSGSYVEPTQEAVAAPKADPVPKTLGMPPAVLRMPIVVAPKAGPVPTARVSTAPGMPSSKPTNTVPSSKPSLLPNKTLSPSPRGNSPKAMTRKTLSAFPSGNAKKKRRSTIPAKLNKSAICWH